MFDGAGTGLWPGNSNQRAPQPGMAVAERGHIGHKTQMSNPWKLIAFALGVALIVVAIVTALIINGVWDFGLSMF